MAGRLEATGNAPSFVSWHTESITEAINNRLNKLHRLVVNVTLILRATVNLDQNQGPNILHNNQGPLAGVNLELARRLAWLSLYFHGVAAHYAEWVLLQEVDTVASENNETWINYMRTVNDLFTLITSLPASWLVGNRIHFNNAAPQPLPAEAPLELAVQICLNIRDVVDPLNTPDSVQDHLRLFAKSNNFPGANSPEAPVNQDDHDGFSNCIFVTQTHVPNRVLVAGSTVLYLGYVNSTKLGNAFRELRLLRFTQDERGYDTKLRLRFRNEPDKRSNRPRHRYSILHWERDNSGQDLADKVAGVKNRLIEEYRGNVGEPGEEHQLLPANDRRTWHAFTYDNASARSNFAARVHDRQQNWFEATPRCLKCRIIHDYNIVNEDLHVKAVANESCMCAEDIVHGKLRELDLVGNVELLGYPPIPL